MLQLDDRELLHGTCEGNAKAETGLECLDFPDSDESQMFRLIQIKFSARCTATITATTNHWC